MQSRLQIGLLCSPQLHNPRCSFAAKWEQFTARSEQYRQKALPSVRYNRGQKTEAFLCSVLNMEEIILLLHPTTFRREGRKGAKAPQQTPSRKQRIEGWTWCLGQQIQSHSSMAERESSCVSDPAEAGPSPKSPGTVPEVPRATWDAGSKQHYAHMSATPGHTPCRNEQSQLLLLHWAETQ